MGSKEDKGPPRWQQALSKGSARTTFVVGALLTLPGASYLAGLHHIPEIADGDAPHTARGWPFQAWALGEMLRLEHTVLRQA